MLLDLIKGNESSPVVVIKDNVDCVDACNIHILYNFLINQAQRFNSVVMLCYENSPEVYSLNLPEDVKNRIIFLDGTKHPHTWLDFQDFDKSGVDGNIKKLMEENLPPGTGSLGIIIDSLSFHLLLRPPSFTCQFLRRISTTSIKGYEVKQVVCGVHEDMFDWNTVMLVQHTASSVISLSPSSTSSHTNISTSVHHRKSGKVIRMSEYFNIDDQFLIKDLTEVKAVPVAIETGNKESDPASNLTFNLTLTDSEKEARSNLVLPHIFDQTKKDSALKERGGGKVIYEADDVDDLDEEDPDDDLHI